MSSGVSRSKSAPTTKPLSAHFLPKNVSFSALEGTSRSSTHGQSSRVEQPSIFDAPEDLYRSPTDSPLTQRVEAFSLAGGFFPTQAHEYDWVSSNSTSRGEFDKEDSGRLSSGTLEHAESPVSTFSSLPATPGAGLSHHPLPDELDHMAAEVIRSEDKMGVLKITARSLSSFILGTRDDKLQNELAPDAEPMSDDALYSAIRARRLEATTPLDEQAHYGELFFGPQPGQAVDRPHGWPEYMGRFI